MKVANDSDAMWELNMSYLWLAQRLLQSDRATGMFRLGVTADVAAALAALSMKHMNELASAGQLICALRPGRYGVLSALTRPTPPVDLVRVHTAMVLAGLELPDEETS
ncbi:flagellar transcriptional regulator FlhD [Burkholderia contaminans]|uniref:Flagellar transcriptional regulator FlhD n=1 Tax=Burkholderia contaminans TaxID=488447 RepID=A0A3N8PX47_9BURK|nr:flagellar transcriptional regulator FlhD [Burkholderia contaminans]RQT16227.1 flagellar transcriptional regulator FlhD [Burkholderia contaminans]